MSREKFTYVKVDVQPFADRDLKEKVEAKAGGLTELAERFGVKVNTASQWGRTRPIPRHLRPRIEEFVGTGNRGDLGVQEDPDPYRSAELRRLVRAVREILESENKAAISMMISAIKACRRAARSGTDERGGDGS